MANKVKIFIVGRSANPIICHDGSNTTQVIDHLARAYGAGILKQGEILVLSETLRGGDYEFHITEVGEKNIKLIKVYVNFGSRLNDEPYLMTLYANSIVRDALKQELLNSSLAIPKNCNFDYFQLKNSKGFFVNTFEALNETEDYVFEVSKSLQPASASEWTPLYTTQLQISFEDKLTEKEFLGIQHNLSEPAMGLLADLNNLDPTNHAQYNTIMETIDDFQAIQTEIRESKDLQDVLRKGLFLMEHYPNNEAIVDNFLVHLFTRLGYYSGMLYAVPQLNLQLTFGTDEIKTAKPDFVILDILTFLRMAVFEEKSVKECQDENAEAQLIAEVIAAYQINAKKCERSHHKFPRTDKSGSPSASALTTSIEAPETIFAVRVAGRCFTFYEMEVTPQIIQAMRAKTSAVSTTFVRRFGNPLGLNFLIKRDREKIITILDAWREKIHNTGQESIRHNSRG